MYTCAGTYLGGRNRPHLIIIWSHEQVGQSCTHHSHNPLVEVLGLVNGGAAQESCIDHAVNALDLLGLGQPGDVVLEGVWNPDILHTYVRNTLVGVPIILLREGLVDAVVEVLVVGEDDMATNVVELAGSCQLWAGRGGWAPGDSRSLRG